jgi:hypothetical protein
MTASFISRYICFQLLQGHSAKDILATLRIEFRKVRGRMRERFSNRYVENMDVKNHIQVAKKNFIFTTYLSNVFFFAARFYFKHYLQLKSFMSLDFILFSQLIYNSVNERLNFINFSYSFLLNRLLVNFVYRYNIS